MMTALEMHIAWRYLRSRRGSQLLSLISTIAIGGVIVGVSALVHVFNFPVIGDGTLGAVFVMMFFKCHRVAMHMIAV